MKAFLLASILLCATSAAHAQQACATREAMLEKLAKDFDEAPAAVGMTANGDFLLELLTSHDGASWTLMISDTNGRSCLVAAGKDWQFLNAPTEPVIGDGI